MIVWHKNTENKRSASAISVNAGELQNAQLSTSSEASEKTNIKARNANQASAECIKLVRGLGFDPLERQILQLLLRFFRMTYNAAIVVDWSRIGSQRSPVHRLYFPQRVLQI